MGARKDSPAVVGIEAEPVEVAHAHVAAAGRPQLAPMVPVRKESLFLVHQEGRETDLGYCLLLGALELIAELGDFLALNIPVQVRKSLCEI